VQQVDSRITSEPLSIEVISSCFRMNGDILY